MKGVQYVVDDHGQQVDFFGTLYALGQNVQLEFERVVADYIYARVWHDSQAALRWPPSSRYL